MRLLPALCAALVATVLAVPAAAAFPVSGIYEGTAKGAAVVRVTGHKKQIVRIKSPNTVLRLNTAPLTYSFGTNASALNGTMTQVEPGKFAIVPPTGQDLTDFVASAQAYFDSSGYTLLTLTSVGISGTHTMKKNGGRAVSKIQLLLGGTSKLGGVPFTGVATYRLKSLHVGFF